MVTLESRKHAGLTPSGSSSPLSRYQRSGEYSIDFDHYMVVYGDHSDYGADALPRRSARTALMLGDRAPRSDDPLCRSGDTSIGCYQGNRLVGSINFYPPAGDHPNSMVDADGLVVLWYPLASFPHILQVLLHEKELTLSLVRDDLDGRQLQSPMASLLTCPAPTGREAENAA